MQINASIILGFEFLQTLVTIGHPMRCKDLAQLMGVNETKANRILQTLKKINMVAQNTEKLYYPGQEVQILATQTLYSSNMLKSILATLNLEPQKDFEVAVGVLWHNTVNYLYFRSPETLFFDSICFRPLYPLEQSSIGILLLAYQPINIRKKILKELGLSLDLYNWEEIKKNRSFIYDAKERSEYSIAVPIGRNPFTAIAYAQLSNNLTKEETSYYVNDLTRIANDISSLVEKKI